MAETIGFIHFTAFELHRANEFDAIKTRLSHADRPPRGFFDIHPSLPPWRKLSQEPPEQMHRRTPAQLQPLMNEYHKYYLEKSVQHESYLRWWRRHHAWGREAEIFFMRFDDLRDHINEIYNREAYIQQGRMNMLFKKAQQKTWLNEEIAIALHQQGQEQERGNSAKVMARKTEQLRIVPQLPQATDRSLGVQPHEGTLTTRETFTRQSLHPQYNPPPKWARLLAVADYAQQIQMQIPQASVAVHPEANKLQSIPPASLIKNASFKV